jgi:hypothetical protein
MYFSNIFFVLIPSCIAEVERTLVTSLCHCSAINNQELTVGSQARAGLVEGYLGSSPVG